jgi:uncharacterized damage-inducible protein DinB
MEEKLKRGISIMADKHLSLTTFYKGWDIYQQHLVNVIAPLTDEQLTLRSAPHQWTVGSLATHIIGARASWFHSWMGEGPSDITLLVDWDEDQEPSRPASELVAGLEATWQTIWTALDRWTPADLEQIFHSPFRKNAPARSRQYIIWHVLEHDMHHGGEISQSLGMHKVRAIDL